MTSPTRGASNRGRCTKSVTRTLKPRETSFRAKWPPCYVASVGISSSSILATAHDEAVSTGDENALGFVEHMVRCVEGFSETRLRRRRRAHGMYIYPQFSPHAEKSTAQLTDRYPDRGAGATSFFVSAPMARKSTSSLHCARYCEVSETDHVHACTDLLR